MCFEQKIDSNTAKKATQDEIKNYVAQTRRQTVTFSAEIQTNSSNIAKTKAKI